MLISSWRTGALGLTAGLAIILSGCEGPPTQGAAPPPPMANTETPPATPDLAGGPPEASPPPPAQADETASMAPIANPEDMTPQARIALYGHRYDHPKGAAARNERKAHERKRSHGVIYAGAAAHPQPWHKAAVTAAAKSAPPAAQARAAAAPAIPAKTADRLLQLQSALAGPVGQGAVLVAADDLSTGKPGAVTLTLPASLLAQIQAEAAKVDLNQSARTVVIDATLGGEGYQISPKPDLSSAAVNGQPLTFSWQVAPQAGAPGGTLKVDAVAELQGAGATKNVPLLSLEKPLTPTVTETTADQATTAPGALNDLDQKLGDIHLPGVGKVAIGLLVAIGVLILAGVALIAAARQSHARDQERRRKARAAAAARFDEQVAAARVAPARPPATTVLEAKPPEKVEP